MDMQLSIKEKEVTKVRELVEKFDGAFKEELSLDENLVNFYLGEHEGQTVEEAKQIVIGLRKGVETFNENLKSALSEKGFDYAEELKKLSADMSLKEKYNVYLDFLAAISTLDMENISDQFSEIEKYEELRKKMNPDCEITEKMMNELEQNIAEVLNNNTLCLGSLESLRNIVVSLPEGTKAVEAAICGSKEDVKYKLIFAMSAYICYKKGELESLKITETEDMELTPEMVAVAAAMGVEQIKALEDLAAGRTTLEKVIHILRIIGGIALFTILSVGLFFFVLKVGILSVALLQAILGTSVLASITTFILGVFIMAKLGIWVSTIPEVATDTISHCIDTIMKTWREKMWPGIKNTFAKVREWIEGHLILRNDVFEPIPA